MDLENNSNGGENNSNGGESIHTQPFPVKFVGCLSNFEVYEYFKEIKDDSTKDEERNKALKSNTHLSTIVYETLQYFNQTPCVDQTKEGIRSFIHRIQTFNLTKGEKLAMINLRPKGAVEIQAIVEECEDRLTDAQVDELVTIIEETLPSKTIDEEDNSGEG